MARRGRLVEIRRQELSCRLHVRTERRADIRHAQTNLESMVSTEHSWSEAVEWSLPSFLPFAVLRRVLRETRRKARRLVRQGGTLIALHRDSRGGNWVPSGALHLGRNGS